MIREQRSVLDTSHSVVVQDLIELNIHAAILVAQPPGERI